jgi:hypothetical protein
LFVCSVFATDVQSIKENPLVFLLEGFYEVDDYEVKMRHNNIKVNIIVKVFSKKSPGINFPGLNTQEISYTISNLIISSYALSVN